MPRISDELAPIYRGDTRTYKLTFVDAEGAPVDVSGHTIWFTMKLALEDDDPGALQHTEMIGDGSSGVIYFTVSASLTATLGAGRYFFDFQWVTDDDPSVVTTMLAGTVTVVADTTRSIVVAE
jgi:hypothetical protein